MLVMRGIPSRIRSGLMEKTATDQTTTRSSKTKRITIQLPPLTGIYKVPGSGSLFARKPEKNIRQAEFLPTLEAKFHRVEGKVGWGYPDELSDYLAGLRDALF